MRIVQFVCVIIIEFICVHVAVHYTVGNVEFVLWLHLSTVCGNGCTHIHSKHVQSKHIHTLDPHTHCTQGSAVYVGTDEGLSVFDVNIQARRAFLHADCI